MAGKTNHLNSRKVHGNPYLTEIPRKYNSEQRRIFKRVQAVTAISIIQK